MDAEVKKALEKLARVAGEFCRSDDDGAWLDRGLFERFAEPILEELWVDARSSVSAQDFEF